MIYTGEIGDFPNHLKQKMWYDEELGLYRLKPVYYTQFLAYTKEKGIKIPNLLGHINLEMPIKRKNFELRGYQQEAFRKWKENNYKGVVVLATGTGKSYIALEAIYNLKVKTLIVVPTLALIDQWKKMLIECLSISSDCIGIWGGGSRELEDITITTYDSSAVHIKNLRKDRGLIIYDEVHHLPAPTYRVASNAVFAPYKLGLSATPERADELHQDLEHLVGPIVIRREPDDFESDFIANFEIREKFIDLTEDERKEYTNSINYYRTYLRTHRIRMRSSSDFKKLIFRTARDKNALKALHAWNKARQIAFNAEKKIEVLEELLKRHLNQKMIIFSEFNDIVEKVGKLFLIPIITHQTKTRERREILTNFKKGKYTRLVSAKVLDEGISVSDASVGVILSGSSQKRQLIQRLGRLLRPFKDRSTEKNAILYELISKNTIEKSTAYRRSLGSENGI
ncbi:MAG: DEAD/DEAH box helicase [Candidatus Lokiarchaeota archaeon]|nr:DEAD/DEAH box helicase [Candidatus Lokiarchaeota archaeon]